MNAIKIAQDERDKMFYVSETVGTGWKPKFRADSMRKVLTQLMLVEDLKEAEKCLQSEETK